VQLGKLAELARPFSTFFAFSECRYPLRIERATTSGRKMENQLHYTAAFEPAEEGGYIVTFPAIPGLATQGKTLVEARAMAADCLRAYLESLRKDGEALPYEAAEGPITERLTVELASA
jgi:antitoxin HicB